MRHVIQVNGYFNMIMDRTRVSFVLKINRHRLIYLLHQHELSSAGRYGEWHDIIGARFRQDKIQ